MFISHPEKYDMKIQNRYKVREHLACYFNYIYSSHNKFDGFKGSVPAFQYRHGQDVTSRSEFPS